MMSLVKSQSRFPISMTRFSLLEQKIKWCWNHAVLTVNRHQTCKEGRFSQPLCFVTDVDKEKLQHIEIKNKLVLSYQKLGMKLHILQVVCCWHFHSQFPVEKQLIDFQPSIFHSLHMFYVAVFFTMNFAVIIQFISKSHFPTTSSPSIHHQLTWPVFV